MSLKILSKNTSKNTENPGTVIQNSEELFSNSLNPNLFQRLVAFMADLREADGLLQRAIEKVDERSKVDTAQVRHACRLSGGDAFRVFAPPGPCQRLVFCGL